MVLGNITEFPVGLVGEIGQIALWLQAIGIVAAILILAEILSFYFNARRYAQLIKIKEDMKRIERKIDKILGKK
ncbi:MAG: hypothetical protein AABW80_04130, partial [Nanoarchaeota archaeon]